MDRLGYFDPVKAKGMGIELPLALKSYLSRSEAIADGLNIFTNLGLDEKLIAGVPFHPAIKKEEKEEGGNLYLFHCVNESEIKYLVNNYSEVFWLIRKPSKNS